MEPLIELKGVVKEFRSVPPVRPLDGVSLAVAPGRIVAVTGVSGKGKSTLLNVMGGLLRADEGSVLYHGTDLARASAARSTPCTAVASASSSKARTCSRR